MEPPILLYYYIVFLGMKGGNLNAEGKAEDIVSQPMFFPSIPCAEESSRDSRNNLGLCELYLHSCLRKKVSGIYKKKKT